MLNSEVNLICNLRMDIIESLFLVVPNSFWNLVCYYYQDLHHEN